MQSSNAEDHIRQFLRYKDCQEPVSINERSLQLFGDEKFLVSPKGQSYLSQHDLSMDLLKVYKSPEPFLYYDTGIQSSDALIIENKDTWYTIRKILLETGGVCGMKIAALIYGEGRKIQSSFAYTSDPEFQNLQTINTYYYFGDLDSSGIDILYKLQNLYGSQIAIFEPGYKYLYDHRHLGRTKELQKHIPISMKEIRVLDFLGQDAVCDIYTFCNHDYLVPQELLNYSVLSQWEWLYM